MKTSFTFIAILLPFLLVSCSNSGSKQVVHKAKPATENNTPQIGENVKDYLKMGFELMQSDNLNNLRIGLTVKDLDSIIGIPSEKTNPEIWGADGRVHQTFKYSTEGVELDLIQKDDSSFSVNMITIKEPCKFKTKVGVGIDSDYKTVESLYHDFVDSKWSSETEIVAGSVYGGIIFRFENKKVKSIFIGAAAE